MMYSLLFVIFFIPLLFLRLKRYGKKNITHKKAIYACNHRSNMDPIALAFASRTKLIFLAKKELLKSKFSKFILLKWFKVIPVDREIADIGAVKQCLNVLKNGKCLGVFPEGTRRNNVSEEDHLALKNGTCMFAIKTQTPIIPTYIAKVPRFFRKNAIVFGAPFELSEFYGQRLTKDVLDNAGKILAMKMEEVRTTYLTNYYQKRFKKEAKVLKKDDICF